MSKQVKSKNHKYSLFPIRGLLVLYDILIYAVVVAFALLLFPRPDLQVSWHYVGQIAIHFAVSMPIIITARFFLRVYCQVWRYGGVQSYIFLMFADAIALFPYFFIQRGLDYVIGPDFDLPFVVVTLLVLSNTTICMAVRMIYRWAYTSLKRDTKFGKFVTSTVNKLGRANWSVDKTQPIEKIRIAIVGAGGLGTALAKELLENQRSIYLPVCFVDNDKEKLGREIYGKEIIYDDEFAPSLLKEYKVQEVILALPPSLGTEERQSIYSRYKEAGFKIKSYDYPSMQSTQMGKRAVRDFDIEDLLFRKEQEVIEERTINYYKNKVVLVTGGGGSIGSEIARQLAKMEPKKLILLDICENGVYDIQQELRMQHKDSLNLETEICSITNRKALEKVFSKHKPNIVIMAAAHKHVPLMENNVIEAVDNNVFGTLNTIEISEQFGVDRVHLVSTDKAVNPTNVMGATKRMCEYICMTHASLKGHTTFSATRFGNVLGSAGSVIPLFKKQIQNGGPVTLTDKRIIRYFMTIPEASQLVLHSAAIAKNGELMVLDMGQPVKIYDLAVEIIKMSGFEPDKDIKIIETGLRPGEKLYEELLVKDERLTKTDNKQIFIEKDIPLSLEELNEKLEILTKATESDSNRTTRTALAEVVPTYIATKDSN